MNTAPQAFSIFEATAGAITFISLVCFAFLAASLRAHVDEQKLRKEGSVSSMFRSLIPPERILTIAGERWAKWAKVALGIFVVTIAVIAVRNQIITP